MKTEAAKRNFAVLRAPPVQSNVMEHRRAPRRRVLKAATIVFRRGNSSMRCKILDLSETGARLAPAHPPLCPNDFVLQFDVGPPRNCEVMWRKDSDLGVRFLLESNLVAFTNNTASVPTFAPAVNNLGLREVFDQSIIANQGDPKRGALLVISISNLGLVKAAYGEETSKTVFSSVERKLQKVLRGLDVMGRLCEDKFGIVLGHCRPEHVPTVAKRFLAAVQSEPVVTRDAVVDVVLSTSIMIPERGMTLSDLIDQSELLALPPLPAPQPLPALAPLDITELATKEPIALGAGHAKLTGALISPTRSLGDR